MAALNPKNPEMRIYVRPEPTADSILESAVRILEHLQHEPLNEAARQLLRQKIEKRLQERQKTQEHPGDRNTGPT